MSEQDKMTEQETEVTTSGEAPQEKKKQEVPTRSMIIMILAGIFPVVGAVLATLPSAVLGGCTIMMFGTIVISGLQMIGKCGFSQRNITISALSLSIGLGFTQLPDLFAIFPGIIRSIFAENCVAVVFLTAIILNLVLPKNMEVERQEK